MAGERMAGATLQFDLPPVVGQAGGALAPTIEKWIGSLPLLNTGESSRALLGRLAQINRQGVEESDLLRVLEMFREPVHGLCLALIAGCGQQPLPFTGTAKNAADCVQLLYDEVAIGYKRLAVVASSRVIGSDGQRATTALYVQRALHTLGRLLAVHFGRYATPPPQTWASIRQLYLFAEKSGLAEFPVPDPLNSCVGATRVNQAYKQAVLVDLAGPFTLPPQMIERVYRYLDAMAQMAELTAAVPALRPDCQFVINLATDRAGITNAESTAVTTEARYRFLNTAALVAAMYAQFTALQKKEPPALNGLAPDFFGPSGTEMLKRLLVAWGVHPRRRFPRAPRAHTAIEMHLGLEAVCRLANNGLPFERSSNLVGPMPKPLKRPAQEEAKGHEPDGGVRQPVGDGK